MKKEEFEFANAHEAGMIGTMSRTTRMWKRNGNIGTIGKELSQQNRKYPPETFVVPRRAVRK